MFLIDDQVQLETVEPAHRALAQGACLKEQQQVHPLLCLPLYETVVGDGMGRTPHAYAGKHSTGRMTSDHGNGGYGKSPG